MSSDFHFLVPESFHKKLNQIGKVVSEKIQFEIFRRNMTILTYLHIFNKMTATTNYQVTGCNSF